MSTEFLLPKLGETVESGTLVKILAAVGDTIEEGQSVLELETDKAVLEVPSTVSGTVQEILVSEGDTVAVDQPIFKMGDAAATEKPAEGDAAESETEASVSEEAKAPAQEKAAAAVQSSSHDGLDKASTAGPALQSPQGGATQNGAESTPAFNGSAPSASGPVPASPAVRRMARELGIDISLINGSGPGGRISDADLKAHSRHLQQGGGSTPAAATAPAAPLPDFQKQGEVERQALSNVRRATAEQMQRAWTIPHVTQFDIADITQLEKLRKQFGPRAEKAGGKLTPTAILIKAVVGALRRFPQFNSSLDLQNSELILKKFINIGIAVDTDRGLLVPVIKDADKKSVIGLAVEMSEMAERARNRKTGLDEMSGGTFTITNLGGIGGTNFTPIINTPEVAILGVARATMEPVWNKESAEFEPRLMMPLALSYDHRVIDGADGARFLRFICELLEDPFLLALEG